MRALWQRERVTLVIENEVVRLMGVRGGQVTRWGSAPLPRDTMREGEVANPAALAQVLERLWNSQTQHSPAPRDNLILAIPGFRVPTRIVPLEGADPASRPGMAQRAREVLPDDGAYHAWQVVGPAAHPGLFVAAAPAALVDGYVEALHRAGLGVVAVDAKPLALIRAVGCAHTVIVDGERAQGAIIVVDESLPRRVRFPVLDAPLLASPEEKITRLAEVLYHTVSQYNREAAGQPLHPAVPIFLTGSLADHLLLRDVVQEVLGHPVGRVAPPLTTPPDMPLSQFMANVGLALKRL